MQQQQPILLCGTFAVGWSDVMCQFVPSITGSHPDNPDDPFALLLHRIRAVESSSRPVVTTTFVDTSCDPLVHDIVCDLARTLLPTCQWTQVVLHANQNEFFDRCVHHGFTSTYHELQEHRTSPAYIDTIATVHHVYIPPYLAETPDTLCTVIRKAIQEDT